MTEYLAEPSENAWKKFAAAYMKTVTQRWNDDPTPFDELAELAHSNDVYLGCSCPTAKNPNVQHCHTVLALEFMQARYPNLNVEYP